MLSYILALHLAMSPHKPPTPPVYTPCKTCFHAMPIHMANPHGKR